VDDMDEVDLVDRLLKPYSMTYALCSMLNGNSEQLRVLHVLHGENADL